MADKSYGLLGFLEGADQVGEKDKKLLDYLTAQAGGNNYAFGGRLGLDSVPLTPNLGVSVGASGYYAPIVNDGRFNTYDAALNYVFGKGKNHNLEAGAQGLNTPDPYYMLRYGYKF